MKYKDRTILVLGTSKGGTGKTTVADASAAAAVAAGHKVLVVDVDDGNSGFKRRAGKSEALALGWSTSQDEMEPWADKHLRGVNFVIFDLGANFTASDAPVCGFMGALVTMLRREGAKVIFLAIASPNAPGTGRLVSAMREDFGSLGDVRLIENNVDGSKAFSASLKTAGLTKIGFGHIDPGVQAVRMQREEPLIAVLRNPAPGYRLATARYARRVLDFVQQASVQDIFGQAVAEFEVLAADAPTGTQYVIPDLARATDDAVTANMSLGEASRRLRAVDRDDRETVYSAAIAFIEADACYRTF